ncbi:MAG TPA: cbb3-type cytochrome c oxidase subunit I, partial [Methylomirabilota bacterium]|nr:cbb3-type cytochrome c oxidase subunit I [Methylomirabilota bacterium]
LSGIMHASPPVDMQQQDSYFVVAHLHYVLVGGSLAGLFAGIYYWWPKITGRLLDERLGRWNFWLFMIGFNVTFFPMHFLGVMGMPRRIYTYAPNLNWELWNRVSTVGVVVLTLSILAFLLNSVQSLRRGAVATADPWDGRTLEWSVPSPPPVYNFAEIPVVRGRDELWARKQGRRPPVPEPTRAPSEIHLPAPSHYPILVALGIVAVVAGALIHLWVSIVGAIVMVYGAYRFAFEYRSEAHT